ncbi:hypothetical protein ACFOYU_14345 [Microvirga sp. GCM10011540]|uniref:hypothetical protein n=1 Tax=Microvirga sp. GCM10011540 TaxID=3317338 RepID=UPI00360DD953
MPPSASIASRLPPLRTKGSFTGTLVDPVDSRILVFESTLEEGWACILRTDHRTREVHDQPAPVAYVDDDGIRRSHTFDFRAVLDCGRKIAYAVKPSSRVASSGIGRTLELIRQQVRPGFADAFVLRTEEHITKDRVHNARLILHSWASRDPDHVEAIARVVRRMRGSALVRDIADASGLGGHALRAIACLIGDGVLRLARPARISHSAFVSPGPRAL